MSMDLSLAPPINGALDPIAPEVNIVAGLILSTSLQVAITLVMHLTGFIRPTLLHIRQHSVGMLFLVP